MMGRFMTTISPSKQAPDRWQPRWPDGRMVAYTEYRSYRIGKAIACPAVCSMTWITGVTVGSDFDNTALAVVLLVALTVCLFASVAISRIRLAAITGDQIRSVDLLRRLHRRPRWPDRRHVAVAEDRVVKTLESVTLVLALAIGLVLGLVGIPKVNLMPSQVRQLNSLATAIAVGAILATILRVKVLQGRLLRAGLVSR